MNNNLTTDVAIMPERPPIAKFFSISKLPVLYYLRLENTFLLCCHLINNL